MWRYDKRLVRALYVGPLDGLLGWLATTNGLPETYDGVGKRMIEQYIADAFGELGGDLGVNCSHISIFEKRDFDPSDKARPKVNCAFGVVLLQDREDEHEVADALNLYRDSDDGRSEKSSQLRQLKVKVEPLGTAFTAIKQANGRVVNLLDEAKPYPLRRAGKVKVLPEQGDLDA
jgi:hypothetical protein